MYRVLKILLVPVRLFRRFATGLAVLALLASLTVNMAMLTVTGVYTAASAALSSLGISTVAAREAGEKLARRNATRKVGRMTAQNVTWRMQRGAARNIASVGGEAIPVLGVAVIAGALAMDVKDACDTAADMAGLEAALATEDDPARARQAAIEAFDCTTMIKAELPSKEDIWAQVTSAPGDAYERAIQAGIRVRDIDWSGKVGTAVDRVMFWGGKVYDSVFGEGEPEN